LASIDQDKAPAPGTGPKGSTGGGVPPQIQPSPGLPERQAAKRRRARVLEMLHTLPLPAQKAITELMAQEDREEAEARQANERSQAERDRPRAAPQPGPRPSESATT
jgi:phospholipid/cholesterol/gamma-HCH transport system ATP-binding protein